MVPRFHFSYSPYFDFALSGGDRSILEAEDSKVENAKRLEEVWSSLGVPMLNWHSVVTGINFKRLEYDIVLSSEIPRTVYHPVIVKYDSDIIKNRGIEAWLKTKFIGVLQGSVHLLVHDHATARVEECVANFNFATPIERNHVLYNALLEPIYSTFFPDNLTQSIKSGPLANVWGYVESEGWISIVEKHLGGTVKPLLEAEDLRTATHEFFN